MFLASPKIFKVALITITLFIIMMPAFAGTFYVRTDGNDANSGLENTPQGAWATIQKAADSVNPSDIIEVQPGTYNEQVTITRSGASGQLITFHANGEVIVDGQSTRSYCIKLDGADYIKIEGFTIRNATDNGILLINSANYNIISNNTCYSNLNSGIRLHNTSNYNSIANNTCYSNGYGSAGALGNRPCGIYLYASSNYNTIDSNICRNNTSTGIWLEGSSSYCTVTNNKTYSNGYGGIIVVGGTNYNTVSYNLIYSNGAMGVDLSYSAHDNTFRNNTIYNNGSNGIQSNNTGYSNTLKNNIIFNNGLNNSYAYGISIEIGSSAASIYNDIYNNGQGGSRNYFGLLVGPGDISLDPLFKSTDSQSPDFLKLKSLTAGDDKESPCIDSGSASDTPDPSSGKRIDIGAYDLYQHDPIAGGLTAEYFDNTNFTNLKLTRIDPRINFDWGNNTPDASLGVDTFSVRWTGLIKIDYAQNYTFYLTTDDGSRLYIDNNLIIDKWFDQGPNEYQATINLTPGLHDIKYEYYENGGWAVAKLYWSSPSISKTPIPYDHLYYFGQSSQDKYLQGGLKGAYSKFTDLNTTPSYVFTRIDPQINFDWGSNCPDVATDFDRYQAKWKGKIRIPTADTYTFYTTTDDGVKLWVNNQVITDGWYDQGQTERSGTIYLAPGLYDIELNYYENGGSAVSKLLWSSTTITKQVIPPTFLYYKNDLITEEGGLYGEYFDNKDLIAPAKIKKVDPNIDYDWLSASPDKLIESDTYSIRWQGQVYADYSEVYTFYANSDDGLKLWVDNQLLISTWWDHGAYEISEPISLTAGWHDIKIEYYENTGHAIARLFYSSPSTPKTVIPQDHLRPSPPLSAEEASLNFYSTLDSAQAVQAPYMGHSASIVETGTGEVTFEWAKFGKGVLLNGTSDGVNKEMILLSSSDLNKKEGTIEFWFKPSWNSDDGIWHRFLCSTYNWNGCLEIFKYSTNSIYFKIVKDGVQHAIVSNTARMWDADSWHNLAFSYGPAGMKFYLDFQEIPISWTFNNEPPYTGPMPDTFASDLYLGGTYWGENPPDAIFDEVKIYNKQIVPSDTTAPVIEITSHQDNEAVSQSPVTIQGTIDDNTATVTVNGIPATAGQGIFTSQPIDLVLGPNLITVIATDQSNNQSTEQINIRLTNLTALWHFDEGQGTIASDSTAYDNDGTIYGATWTQDGSNWSLQFDGVDDYVNCGNDPSLNITDEITIEAWINAANKNNGAIVRKGGAYVMYFYSNNLDFYLWGPNHRLSYPLINLSTGKWYHIAMTYDRSYMRIYVNGNKVAEASETAAIATTPNALGIGIDIPSLGFPFSGLIDEVKIYDRALTSQEIAEGYNQDMLLFDKTAPTGTVVINNNAQYTTTREVTLTLSAIDDLSGVSLMQLSNNVDNWPDPPVAYQTTYPWTLSEGDGTKTVYVKFRDAVGNWSAAGAISDSVVLDSTRPTVPTVNPVISPTNISTQTLSGTKEANSSIWINGSEAVPLDNQTAWSKIVNLSEGTNNFSITSKDAAGNESQPPVEVSIVLDTSRPTGTIKINDDAQYTKTKEVLLTLPATDTGTGVAQMKFSDDGVTWPYPPVAYQTPYPWTLTTPGDGEKAVYVKFIDAANNESEPAASDMIILDTIAPVINIGSPQDGYISSTGTITVEGTIDDNAATVIVKVNDDVEVPVLPSNGTFAVEVPLDEGSNTIVAIATDVADNQATSNSINVIYDATAPTTPVVTDDGDYTNSLTTLHATWTSQDLESGVAEYQYSIGTTPGGTDLVDWTSVGTATEVTRNDLTLVAGTIYFINVKARNSALPISPSTWSQVGSSNGIIANPSGPIPLAITITSPPEGERRVNTFPITVSGTVSDSTATVKVNNLSAVVNGNTFTAEDIPLTPGTNIITAKATKDTEAAEDSIDVVLDQDPPSINIYTPDANATTRSNIVYGRVSDDTESVTVNGTPAEILSDFRFIARPTLTEGANTITAQAQDQATNTNQASVDITYNTQTPKVIITSPLDNSTQNISPIQVQGTNTTDLSFIMVNLATAIIDATNFTAEGIALDTTKTVITATGFDATDNKFQDAIVVNSPNLSHYELIKVSGDATEDDPARPSAGANQILKVKLEKNGLPAQSEEVQFSVTQGTGAVSPISIFTDINGEAEVTLTTDINSDITNQVECYPTSNPLVKDTFYVDTQPALPSILTKITDDSVTPVPGATIPLIVKLTDSNNNPIQDETISFEVMSGDGTLSGTDVIPEQAGIQTPTNYYGEAKVDLTCPNLGLVLTQIQASSSTVPSVSATFNIATSLPLVVTTDDLFNKVNWNAQKIQDQIVEVTVTSNDPYRPATSQYRVWQKGDLMKVQDISTGEINTRPQLTQSATASADMQIISYDSNTNIYIVKTKIANQTEERPYTITYIDYSKGAIVKREAYYDTPGFKTMLVIEMKDFIQLPEVDNVWVYNTKVETMYQENNVLVYTTTTTVTSQQFNVGLTDGDFQ